MTIKFNKNFDPSRLILSTKEFAKRRKEAEKKERDNKGFIRLLKDLEKNWRAGLREDAIWNNYLAWSHDLENMERQGILHMTEVNDGKGQTHKYYKIGLGGFQYLYLRKINRFVIWATIFTGLSFLGLVASFIFGL